MAETMRNEGLEQENQRLRQENAQLRSALEELQMNSVEPQEVIRAIRYGEIDALVVEEEGQEQIYSLQRFDSVYRTVVEECFPYGVWLAKPDGTLLYVTPSFMELLDTDMREMQEKGQFHFLPFDAREAVKQEWTKCRKTGENFSVEYTVRIGDDSERTIWTQGLLAQTHDGLPHWIGVNIDVTDRKKAEDALRLSEERFRHMADAMPQIVWVARPDGYHEYYNQRWYDYIGCTPEECIGHGWNAPLHPEDRQPAVDSWTLALETGKPYEIKYRFRRKDGKYHWFLGRAMPVRDESNRIVRWFGTCTDIEDMKLIEEALRESEASHRATEERLIAAMSASGTGTFRWNPEDGTFLDFDNNLKQLFGLTPNDSVLATEDIIHRVHPDDRSNLLSAVERCRQGADLEMEFRVVSSDGGIRWLYDRAKMVRDSGGRPTHLVGACIDITARKQQEEALKEADRRKDEFLATLAHELRNPLAPIHTGLELMRMAGDDRALIEDVRNMMEGQTQHLVRLVDDLLDVSRITSGKVTLQKCRVELASVVRSAVEATRSLVEQAGHELTIALPPQSLLLQADPTRLTQVFSNLLTNAARYTPPGGHIWLTAEQQTSEVIVKVKDTGIGLPASMQDRVFEMFTQVDRSLERSEGGLGIGLTLVKRLVEMHGGSIEARSEGTGKGSEFTLRLPILAEQVQVSQPSIEPSTVQSSELRILIVDDNDHAAKMLSMVVRKLGNEVCTACDGLEAIQVAAEFHPDVVLMDLGMPKLNGYDAARRMREQSWGEQTVLIALTGWGQEEDRQRTKEAGFDHHLVKPVEAAELSKILADQQRRGSLQ